MGADRSDEEELEADCEEELDAAGDIISLGGLFATGTSTSLVWTASLTAFATSQEWVVERKDGGIVTPTPAGTVIHIQEETDMEQALDCSYRPLDTNIVANQTSSLLAITITDLEKLKTLDDL